MVVDALIAFNERRDTGRIELIKFVNALPSGHRNAGLHILMGRLRTGPSPARAVGHHQHMASPVNERLDHLLQLLLELRTLFFTLIIDDNAAVLHVVNDLFIADRVLVHSPRSQPRIVWAGCRRRGIVLNRGCTALLDVRIALCRHNLFVTGRKCGANIEIENQADEDKQHNSSGHEI